MMDQQIPQSPAQLTPGWLTEALQADGAIGGGTAVSSFDAETVGEGVGFIGLLARLHLQYSGQAEGAPRTIIAKFPSQAEGARAIGKLYGLYEREVHFYSDISSRVGVYTPRCYHYAMDVEADRYILLLEDLATSGQIGDQVQGCSDEQALLAVREIAGLHARWWNSPKLDEIAWLPRGTDLVRGAMEALYPQVYKTFLELFGEKLPPEISAVMSNLGDRIIRMLTRLEAQPQTIVHADFRLDNMFFGDDDAPYRLAVFDWQGTNRSAGAYDLAYFISSCIPTDRRRRTEAQLIEEYHSVLLAGGVQGYQIEELRDDYRRSLVLALAILSVSAATLEMTNERAVQLFEVIFDGLNAAIVDSDALALLPA